MIKLLKKYEIQAKPFEATKNWAVSNIRNDNLLLYESTGSDDGLPYALEFMDYGVTHPSENDNCDIALEQQDYDLATLELGLKIIGIFYPELDPINPDGTYKRSVYHQVKTMFYNDYLDPTKIWGVENIDFPLSRTERRLSDEIRLLDIPRNVFGDKIIPKSVRIVDDTTDNEYTITDDGNGNLFAGVNLFSHQQEVRNHENEFDHGSTAACDWYFKPQATPVYISESSPPVIEHSLYGGLVTPVILYATDSAGPVNMEFFFGTLITNPPFTDSSSVSDYSLDSGLLFTTVTPHTSPPDSASVVDHSLYSGLLFETVVTASAPPDTASVVDHSLYSGLLFETVVTASAPPDSASVVNYSLYDGILVQIGIEAYALDSGSVSGSIYISFYSGTMSGTYNPLLSSLG